MRVALYARVSTDRQETENQLLILRAFCQTAGFTIIFEYVDEAVSGKSAKRPAFQRMLAAASRRQFDLLLFWSLDRLSREGALATLQHLEKLDAVGVAWRSHSEPFFDSCGPFKDAVIAIIGTVAKMERQSISERTRAGLARVKAKGARLGRPLDAAARQLALTAHQADPAASARALARRLGLSRGTVARALAIRERKRTNAPEGRGFPNS